MGLFYSVVGLLGDQERRFLILGLEGSGKSTILDRLTMGKTIQRVPTVGLNVETLQFDNIHFTVWDVGSQDRTKSIWSQCYDRTQGLIYVVDSNDVKRIEESALELQKLLLVEELRASILLVMANKQDLPNNVSVPELTEKLGLHRVTDRPWFVQSTNGQSQEGLFEGLQWLAKTVKDKYKN